MKALFKLLLGVAALGLILIIALVVTLATLDPNEHKDWIEAKFKKETSRTLTLEGDLGVTFYPWLGVETNGITVSNAPGFGDRPFFHADHVNVRVKLLPLLHGQYEIDTIHINGAVVNLAKNKEGKSNWDDLAGTEKKKSKASIPLAAMILGGVDIQNAKLSWNDQSTDTRYNISKLTMTTGELTYGEPIQLNLVMQGTSNKPDLGMDLNLSGTISYDLDSERYDIKPLQLTSTLKGKNVPDGEAKIKMAAVIGVNMDDQTAAITDLEFTALGTRLTGTINASNLDRAKPSVQANLKIDGDELAVLFKVAEQETLAAQIARLQEKKYGVSASINADMQRGDVNISDLKAQLLGASILGNIKARNIESPAPSFQGELTASGPDLPTLLQVLGQIQGGSDSVLTIYGKGLSRFNNRRFSIKTDFDTDLKSGEAEVKTLTADAVGIKLNGNLKARNMQTKTPSYKGSVTASGPDLPALLEIAGQAQSNDSLMKYGKQLSQVSDRTFAMKTNFDADLESGNIKLPALNIETLGVKLEGNLDTKNMQSSKGTANGKLHLTGKNLASLMTALDQKALGDVLQSVDFNTEIKGKRDDIQLVPMMLKATFAGKQIPNSPVDLALLANTTINLENDSLNMNNLSISGLGLNIKGNLHADKVSEQHR